MAALTVLSSEIRQFDGLYSLNDLHQAAGGASKHKPANFMRVDTTQALMEEIRCSDVSIIPAKTVRGRGKPQGTYVCKELVYAYAMWISPSFHLKVIRAFDALQAQPTTKPCGFPFDFTASSRVMVFLDHNGAQHIQPIPRDAYVLTRAQIVRAIGCGQDLPLSPAELAEVITGASGRLARVLGQGRAA